jgi:acyl carrier protein
MLAERVIEIVAAKRNLAPERVTLDSTFADLGIDSLQGLNLLFDLETAFNVNIPNQMAMQVRTVRDLVENLEKVLAGSAASAPA